MAIHCVERLYTMDIPPFFIFVELRGGETL
jgi:hypothetical protein